MRIAADIFALSATPPDSLIVGSQFGGFYYGVLLTMGLYNLFIYLSARNTNYLYYAGFALSCIALHLAYEDVTLATLWPELAAFNHYFLPVTFALNLLFLSLFIPGFLDLKQYHRPLFRVFRGFTALVLVSVIMQPLLSERLSLVLYHSVELMISLMALAIGAVFWLKNIAATRFFTIAVLAFIVGLNLALLRDFGIIPTNTLSLYAYQLGTFLEVVLLSLALAERTTSLQRAKNAAQIELNHNQTETIKHLKNYEDLYQNSLTGKFQVDRDGYFVKSNASWREIIGYPDESYFLVENPRFNDLFSDSKQRRTFWKNVKEQGQLQAYIASLTQPTTGERVVVSITMRKGSTNPLIWYASGQDITENYLKEQALIQLQKEKVQSLRQLVIGIASKMQPPLQELATSVNYLRQGKDTTPEQERQHEIRQGLWYLEQGSRKLHELNQLMQDAVVEEEDFNGEAIDIRVFLEEWQAAASALYPPVQLKTAVHSYLVDWPTYPEALQLVLNQLLTTSYLHNQEQAEAGKLKVRVEVRERSEFLELHYQDNGRHLSDTERDLIFMPFYSASSDTTTDNGLGLYQSYNLLTELLQGYIEWPETDEGFYMLVKFNLPSFAAP